VPDGLIHHWVGTVFVPGVSVKQAVALLQDYDRHANYFAPAVARSKLLERDGARFPGRAAVLRQEDHRRDDGHGKPGGVFHPAPDRAHSRIRSTRSRKSPTPGHCRKKRSRRARENGFHVEPHTYWRFLERDGGTYIQCES
jgi:hypothetical protein